MPKLRTTSTSTKMRPMHFHVNLRPPVCPDVIIFFATAYVQSYISPAIPIDLSSKKSMQTDVIDHGGHTGGLRFTQKCIGLILIEVEVVRNFGTFGVPETRPGRLQTWSITLPVCSEYAITYV